MSLGSCRRIRPRFKVRTLKISESVGMKDSVKSCKRDFTFGLFSAVYGDGANSLTDCDVKARGSEKYVSKM